MKTEMTITPMGLRLDQLRLSMVQTSMVQARYANEGPIPASFDATAWRGV
jgi:hypothetical protein